MHKNINDSPSHFSTFQFENRILSSQDTKKPINIGFFVRHFTERGTEVAIFDYAKYNEEILNNKSYIICFTKEEQERNGFPSIRESYQKFKDRFEIIEINKIEEMKNVINNYNLHFFYTLTYGGYNDIYQFKNVNIWGSCKTIKHCVFNLNGYESDFYIGIGNILNKKYNTNYPIIPHIISLPDCNEDLRKDLNIPNDAIVFGRHGGKDTFNNQIAHQAIAEFLNSFSVACEGEEKNMKNFSTNTYFLFMGTQCFYNHPRIIYLDTNIDLIYKTKFINTCDAMIHARLDGETFGLSVAEFSIRNKPVITTLTGDLEHINILKDKAIIYDSKESLLDIFQNIETIKKLNNDWNAYREYSPTKVMSIFKELVFDKY